MAGQNQDQSLQMNSESKSSLNAVGHNFIREYASQVCLITDFLKKGNVSHVLYHRPGVVLMTEIDLMRPNVISSKHHFEYIFTPSSLMHAYSSPSELRDKIEDYYFQRKQSSFPLTAAFVIENLTEFYKSIRDAGLSTEQVNLRTMGTSLDEALNQIGTLAIYETAHRIPGGVRRDVAWPDYSFDCRIFHFDEEFLAMWPANN